MGDPSFILLLLLCCGYWFSLEIEDFLNADAVVASMAAWEG